MKTRIFRTLVCLLVICALIVNISPIRAKATAAGGAAIVKASTVTGNPYIIAGAALVALGVMVGAETGAFETVVDNAVSYLETAGGWIEDGAMQLIKTVTDAGTTAYYVAGDLLETLRSWLFGEEILSSPSSSAPFSTSQTGTLWGKEYTFSSTEPFSLYIAEFTTSLDDAYPSFIAFGLGTSGIIRDGNYATGVGSCGNYTLFKFTWGAGYVASNYSAFTYVGKFLVSSETESVCLNYLLNNFDPHIISTDRDLSLGNVSSVPIDGTSALDWSEDYANRQLRVIEGGGGSEDPDNSGDNNNWKWYIPLALGATAAAVIASTQDEQMFSETPEEFPEGDTVTEFEILDAPEIDGYQGLEITPIPGNEGGTSGDGDTGDNSDTSTEPTTSPGSSPDTDTDTGTDTDSGADSNPDSEQNPDAEQNPAAGQNPDSSTSGENISTNISDYTLELKDFFPFCIPYDVAAFVEVLDAEPEAPHFEFDVDFPYMDEPWHIDIDFSSWDPVALVLRRLELLLFIVGLAMATRNYYIRG